MPNTKTKKFDWQIFLAVSCILLVICCATICCVIGNTENGVASAYESESVVSNTNENISIFNPLNHDCYNLVYFNPYADFNIPFSVMYIACELHYDDSDGYYVHNFFTMYIGSYVEGKAFFISYPDEGKYVFILTTDDGYNALEESSFRENYPTSSSFIESYVNDFARICIVCDLNQQNYSFTLTKLLYTDIFGVYNSSTFLVEWNNETGILDESTMYPFDTMFSYNTNFFVTNTSFHDLPRFKFIDVEDFAYFNYRITRNDHERLLNFFNNLNQEDFVSGPYYDDDILDGLNGILLATFSQGEDVYKFYYSFSYQDFVYIKNDIEMWELFGYYYGTNYGFWDNFVSSAVYTYTDLDYRLLKFNVVSITPIFDEYYYELHTLFSGTYNFLTYDTALMYKAIGTASDSAYENGYQTGVNEGYNQGFSAGHSAGYDTGHDAGYDAGHTAGYDDAVSELQPQIDELRQENSQLQIDVDRYENILNYVNWFTFIDSSYNNVRSASFQGMKTTMRQNVEIDGVNGVYLSDITGTAQGLICLLDFGTTLSAGTKVRFSWKEISIGYQTGSNGPGDFMPVHLGVKSDGVLIDCYVTTEDTRFDSTCEFVLPVDAHGIYLYNSEATTYIFISAMIGQYYSYNPEEVYDSGYNSGFNVGKSQGLEIGRQEGYNQGIEDANDYSFFGLFTAIFDAPITSIVGKWGDSDGDGVYEREGGMLNFYIPGLDINFAPFLLSLFTIAIIVLIIRFILARKS